MKRLIPLVAFLLFAAWAHATYVVILRSGARVIAREKMQIKGSTAWVTLKNGTLTSIPVAQIDLPTTDKVNARNLGDAELLAWVDVEPTPTPTPTPTPSVSGLGRIRSGLASPINDAARPTPTPGISLQDRPYRDAQVQRTFEEGLERFHIYLYRTSQGTEPSYFFVELRVNGQNEVVKALQAVCSTYHVLAQTAPERAPERLEIEMLNESGREAGLFRITAAEAGELATAKITPEEFFIRHVIF